MAKKLVVIVLMLMVAATAGYAEQHVIVKARRPYTAAKADIARIGGEVVYEFKNADGLVVVIPDDKVAALSALKSIEYFVRDALVPQPEPKGVVTAAEAAEAIALEGVQPETYYTHGSELTHAFDLHQQGLTGNGVVVGLIDSGVSANVAALLVNPTNPALGSRVIGGQNFVPGATEPGATSPLNNPHGTWVATTIGGNVGFLFSSTSALATAVRLNCPNNRCSFPLNTTLDVIPIVGQAPAVRFFSLKVFPASGGGAPTSRILQAMDFAIQLKQTTQPNMKVVNMSLGGGTLFAGGDIEDQLAASMAAAGITLVVAAGNGGPSGSTVGSPGTAHNILTVGAASDAIHERIVADLFFLPPGLPGSVWRPDASQQIADFSSRGPNADGRIDPELVANGVWAFAQHANGSTLNFISGTSLSTPTVAGIAVLLYQHKPSATPAEIRTALISSADPEVIPEATPVDQGAGYVNAAAAKLLLDGGTLAPIADVGPALKKVSQNVNEGAGILPITDSSFAVHLDKLRQSERREFYFVVDKNTEAVEVAVSNITPELPADQQNQLFGDDIQFAVQSAVTSFPDYLTDPPGEAPPGPIFLNDDATFTFSRPQTGLMRITVLGDWTNAGRVSADLRITERRAALPAQTFTGKILDGQIRAHTLTLPAGLPSVSFRLSFDGDWGSYPTNDVDLILIAPDGTLNLAGATFASPETVTISNPQAGTWTLVVAGFTVFGRDDSYEIRVDF
jgi:subtilisin family serine protease